MKRNDFKADLPRLRSAAAIPAISRAALFAYGRKHYYNELGQRLIRDCVANGIALHSSWPAAKPAKSGTGARAVAGSPPPPEVPPLIESLHCPACGVILDMPQKTATIQCVKCLHRVKVDVVVRRSITVSVSD